jgi:hypothetical protein
MFEHELAVDEWQALNCVLTQQASHIHSFQLQHSLMIRHPL